MAGLFKRFLCRHKQISIDRAHTQSPFGKANQDKAAWTDEKNCYAFIYCIHCKKIFSYIPTNHIYGEKTL